MLINQNAASTFPVCAIAGLVGTEDSLSKELEEAELKHLGVAELNIHFRGLSPFTSFFFFFFGGGGISCVQYM